VYGAAWPTNATQPLPFGSDFSNYFNNIAYNVMADAGIPVMDTFYLTLPRADHRETTHGKSVQRMEKAALFQFRI
jgi:hypothetical protein